MGRMALDPRASHAERHSAARGLERVRSSRRRAMARAGHHLRRRIPRPARGDPSRSGFHDRGAPRDAIPARPRRSPRRPSRPDGHRVPAWNRLAFKRASHQRHGEGGLVKRRPSPSGSRLSWICRGPARTFSRTCWSAHGPRSRPHRMDSSSSRFLEESCSSAPQCSDGDDDGRSGPPSMRRESSCCLRPPAHGSRRTSWPSSTSSRGTGSRSSSPRRLSAARSPHERGAVRPRSQSSASRPRRRGRP